MEKSAEYLNQDGLVTCLTVYADTARELHACAIIIGAYSLPSLATLFWSLVAGKDRREVRNYYKHRTDGLLSRILHCNSHQVVESFAPGRQRSLKGIQS